MKEIIIHTGLVMAGITVAKIILNIVAAGLPIGFELIVDVILVIVCATTLLDAVDAIDAKTRM